MANISMSKMLGKGYTRFFRCRNFYRVVKGGRGSKKSKNTALSYVHDILKYPWSNLLVIRRFSNTNKQSTYTDLKWAIHRMGVSKLFRFNESMPEITVEKTGQKILFRGLDDPLKITSISVDVGILSWIWIEEAYQIENMDKFDTLIESVRGSVPDKDFYKQVTLTFNPWSDRHWLKREFFDAETKRDDVFAITTTFRCNEWLDDSDRNRYISMYKTNPRRAKVVCDGDWGVTEGLIYTNWEEVEFNFEDIREFLSCFGLDFGYTNDPSALFCGTIDKENKIIYVFDEMYQRGMSNERIYEVICTKGYKKERIIADSAEPKSIDRLRTLGLYRIQGAKKGRDSVNSGIDFIQDYKVLVHPKCENFIAEISNYVWDRDKLGNATNKPVDDYNHLMDAMRYALEPHMTGARFSF